MRPLILMRRLRPTTFSAIIAAVVLCAVCAAPASAARPELAFSLASDAQIVRFDPAADLSAGRTKTALNVAMGANGSLVISAAKSETGRLADSYGVISGGYVQTARAFDSATVAYDVNVPQGAQAAVDVRFSPDSQKWTVWKMAARNGESLRPATDLQGGFRAAQTFGYVQYRLRLASAPDGSQPQITNLRVTTDSVTAQSFVLASTETTSVSAFATNDPPTYRVYATREGLVGGRTASGHVITERDHFVSLPDCAVVSDPGTKQYQVRVVADNGRSAVATVLDCGPWNFHDNYWHNPRREFKDLPVGMPQAEAAALSGHNGGYNEAGWKIYNPSGIDVGDGTWWDELGLAGASGFKLAVTFLWENGGSVSTPAPTPTPAPAPPNAATDFVGYVVAGKVGINYAQINWTTTTPTTSQVEWSMGNAAYNNATKVDGSLNYQHSITLVDLSPGNVYYFRARSRDASGKEIIGIDHTLTTQPGKTPALESYSYDAGLTGTTSAAFDQVDINGTRTNNGDWSAPGFQNYRAGAYLRDGRASGQGNLDFNIVAACDSKGNNCAHGRGSGYKAYVQFGLNTGDFVRYGVIHDLGIAPKGAAYFVESRVNGVFKATYGADGSADGGIHHWHISWINGIVRGFWDNNSMPNVPDVAFSTAGTDVAFVGAGRGRGDSLSVSIQRIGFSDGGVQ